MTSISKLWAAYPVVLTLVGSAAFWSSAFALLVAFHVPITPDQQTAISVFAAVVAGGIIHTQVLPKSGATLPTGTTITVPATAYRAAQVATPATPATLASPATPAVVSVIGPNNPAPFATIQAAKGPKS